MSKILLSSVRYPFEPLGIGYLAASLKDYGHEVKYATYPNLMLKISQFNPDYVGFNILTGNHIQALKKIELIKSIYGDIKIIVGGSHPTFFPEFIYDNIDYLVIGEGEKAIVDIVSNKEDNKVIIGKLEEDLNKISFPDREVIYEEMQNERTNPIKHIITSRGCPFSCPYCYNDGYKKIYPKQNTVRHRSVDNVIDEIKELKKDYNIKFIQFQDDSFTSNKAWLEEFLSKYKEEIDLPFHAIVRIDQLDKHTIKKLKKSGCVSVRTALESGNDYLRQDILKRKMSKEKIEEMCSYFHKYHIKFMLQNILGLPEGDLSMDLETLEFNKKLNPTYAWASLFQPYPGTELGDKHNIDLNKIKDNFYDDTPLEINDKYQRIILRRNFARLVNGKTIEQANKELYLGLI